MLYHLLLIITLNICGVLPLQIHSNSTDDCQGWTVPYVVDGDISCKCGARLHDTIICNNNTLNMSVQTCSIVSYDKERKEFVAGYAFYGCNIFNILKTDLRANATALSVNSVFCQEWNREGLMCGRCIENYGVPLYSYQLKCVKCSNDRVGWVKYVAISYIPLTVFYIFLAVFRISATSGVLNTFILVSQLVAAPSQIRLAVHVAAIKKKYQLEASIGSLFFGVWNLDFLRSFYHPFCVEPSMSTMHVLALDYLIGVYPIALIMLTYVFVRLHDSFPLIVKIWMPFQLCLSKFSRKWDIRNSIISYFATFILLSYVKILNVSFDLLLPTTLYDVHGKAVKTVLYYDGQIEVFGSKHIPFAILAILMTFTFNIFPLVLLTVYPCQCFQKVLNCMKLRNRWLHTLMDAFQGCYHNRYFAALFVLLRLINLMLFSLTLNLFYYFLISILITLYAFVIAFLKPYRNKTYNFLDVLLLLVVAIAYLMLPMYIETIQLNKKYLKAPLWTAGILFGYVFLYGSVTLVYILSPRGMFQRFSRFLSHQNTHEEEEEPFPHRFSHMGSREYGSSA